MTRTPRPRRPLSDMERAQLEGDVLHLLREALREDYAIYCNRADYAQAWGMAASLRVLRLMSDSDVSRWFRKLEEQAAKIGPPPHEPRLLPAVNLPTPEAAVEEALRRVINVRRPVGPKGSASYARGVRDALFAASEVLFALLEQTRESQAAVAARKGEV